MRFVRSLGSCFAALLSVLLLVCCCASGVVLERASSFEWPPGDHATIPAGDGSMRAFVVSRSILPEARHPVFVLALEREVWYVDSESFEIIRVSRYQDNENLVISNNGKYLAVTSRIWNRRTKSRLNKVRVEDWTGRILWEIEATIMSAYEPTPTGGLIMYTSSPTPMADPVVSKDFKIVPKPLPHGLRIYDSEGTLLLEGVGHEELRLGYKGLISPDGKRLAFAYEWVPPENRDRRLATDRDDKACLVLYDLEGGLELWRHYFEGNRLGKLAITQDAARIICFVSAGGVWPHEDYTMFLFDREGNEVAERQIATPEGSFTIRRKPVLSPSGRYCTAVADRSHAYLIDLDGGAILWQFDRPAGTNAIRCLATNDAGTALFVATKADPEATDFARELWLVDGSNQTRLSHEEVRLGGGINYGVLAADASCVWLVQRRKIVRYGIGSARSSEGGGGSE